MACLTCLAVGVASGAPGAQGMAVGILSGGFGAGALAGLSFYMGRLMAARATPQVGTTILVLATFVKFPLLLLGWVAVKELGPVASRAFVGGILLVYSSLVGWAATRNVAEP